MFVKNGSRGFVSPSSKLAQSRCFLIAIASICFLAGCGPAGPKRYDVSGTVTVDGTPAEGMLIQLVRRSPGEGNDQYPSTLSRAGGKFAFGSQSETPGLIEGEYAVTFAWLEGKDLEARDKFRGKLSDPKTTPHQLKVPAELATDLSYDLKTPK